MHRDELPIDDPCHADWSAMEPRERGRFCASCSVEVIDVSAYTAQEARALAAAPRPERVCMSYVVRGDGRIRFADTPDVAVSSLFKRGRSLVAAATLALAACQPAADGMRAMGFDKAANHLEPPPEIRLAGAVAYVPPPDAGVPTPPVIAPDAGVIEDHRVRGGVRATSVPCDPSEPR